MMHGLIQKIKIVINNDKRITAVLLILALLVTLLLILSPKFPPTDYPTAILFAAVITFMTTAIIDISPQILDKIDRNNEKAEFTRFFGKACASGGVTLLFTNRKLTENAERNQSTWDIYCKSFRKESGGSTEAIGNARPEGITLWLPFQDFRGANYVASEIARVTKKTAYYRTDKSIETFEIDDLDKTIISFGLGFNKFSHTLSDLTNRNLFKIKWSETARAVKDNFDTDNFELPDVFSIIEKIKDSKDYALLVRIAVKPLPNKPQRYFFMCAGRTASGTAAAGYYLANHWKDIIKLYSGRQDLEKTSVAIVLEHWFGHDVNLTPDADRDHDASVKIAKDAEGKDIIKWWPN